jgi:hypothetical protein
VDEYLTDALAARRALGKKRQKPDRVIKIATHGLPKLAVATQAGVCVNVGRCDTTTIVAATPRIPSRNSRRV